jgi:hypothetical protein
LNQNITAQNKVGGIPSIVPVETRGGSIRGSKITDKPLVGGIPSIILPITRSGGQGGGVGILQQK